MVSEVIKYPELYDVSLIIEDFADDDGGCQDCIATFVYTGVSLDEGTSIIATVTLVVTDDDGHTDSESVED